MRSTSGATGASSWQLAVVAPGFVTGEETALVSALEGATRSRPFTPPRPFERGVRGAPTLVQNVETLAHVALIARLGPDWFRALGTRDEPGSALFTVSGAVGRPGRLRGRLRDAAARARRTGGGVRGEPGAFLVGGYFGSWVDAVHGARRCRCSTPSSPRRAPALGAGAIVVLPAAACGLDQSARVARYLADESAGQCGPCVHGLAALAGALETLAARPRRQPAGRAALAGAGRRPRRLPAPDGAARFVESSLEVFADEVELHLRGRCSGRRGEFLPTRRSRVSRAVRVNPIACDGTGSAPSSCPSGSRSTTGATRSSTRAR